MNIYITLTQNYIFEKFGSKTETHSSFYEIWHLQQKEHANNTCECLEGSRDYWFKMATGSMIAACKI